MIVKIQRPLFSTGELMALVYNKDRTVELMYPWAQVEWLFKPYDLKLYYYATLNKGVLSLSARAPEQEW